jgi:hypothetical protein
MSIVYLQALDQITIQRCEFAHLAWCDDTRRRADEMDLCRIDQARRSHATDVADESGRLAYACRGKTLLQSAKFKELDADRLRAVCGGNLKNFPRRLYGLIG